MSTITSFAASFFSYRLRAPLPPPVERRSSSSGIYVSPPPADGALFDGFFGRKVSCGYKNQSQNIDGKGFVNVEISSTSACSFPSASSTLSGLHRVVHTSSPSSSSFSDRDNQYKMSHESVRECVSRQCDDGSVAHTEFPIRTGTKNTSHELEYTFSKSESQNDELNTGNDFNVVSPRSTCRRSSLASQASMEAEAVHLLTEEHDAFTIASACAFTAQIEIFGAVNGIHFGADQPCDTCPIEKRGEEAKGSVHQHSIVASQGSDKGHALRSPDPAQTFAKHRRTHGRTSYCGVP